ncbi:MAG: aspartate aminotransferase family protein [Lysobacteraceae bacterium]|nr:MAG: aspartate aminotransferase family protein [Xanthomonadaceae bacterium]
MGSISANFAGWRWKERENTVETLYRRHINPYWLDTLEELSLPSTHVRGDGLYLYDESGEAWLDLVAGYGAVSLGHHPPEITRRVAEAIMAGGAPGTYPWGANLPSAELAHRLVAKSPLPEDARAVFACGGAESVETAMKLAMAHTGRTRFLSFRDGFHGLTLEAMALNGNAVWRRALPDMRNANTCVDMRDVDAWTRHLREADHAGVVIELVQGIGGGAVWGAETLATLVECCRETGTLVIVDEVQTGLGRTGRYFASEKFPVGLAPDIIVLAKGLTAGILPLSVALCRAEIHHSLFGAPGCARIHGSTYAGYGAGIVAGMAVLDFLESHEIPAVVARTSAHVRGRLEGLRAEHRSVASIEGEGLLITVTFSDDCPDLSGFCLDQCIANRVLVNLSAHRPNTIKLTPPLTIGTQELDDVVDLFDAALQAYAE